MMKKVYTLILLLACIPLWAMAQDADNLEDAAPDTAALSESLPSGLGRYELRVEEFTHLNVVDGINVEYHCSNDSAGLVTFTTTRDIASNLLFGTNGKGKLTVEKAFHPEGGSQQGLPVVHVYSRFLTEVTNAGDSLVRVHSPKPTPKFKASLIGNGKLSVRGLDCGKVEGAIKTGNGTLTLSGECREAVLGNTGVGVIIADSLKAQKAVCKFFGNGTTGVWAIDELIVKGMLPGKLYYKDTPQKIRNYSVGVKLIPMPSDEDIQYQ